MRLSLIQSSETNINSIYIIRNFIEDDMYLEYLNNKVCDYTKKDEMHSLSNVKANMTNYKKLLNDNDFEKLHIKILNILAFIFRLRTPHPEESFKFIMNDSWGMRHKQYEKTINHIHTFSDWSGAFYFTIPNTTIMNFPDFQEKLILENNMLVLFQSYTKHSVDSHESDKDRISMAFNIEMEPKDK
tara:strand:- start:617 stop:1174 length:558 start_codon:yes stop_codon:yes gene_type:complete